MGIMFWYFYYTGPYDKDNDYQLYPTSQQARSTEHYYLHLRKFGSSFVLKASVFCVRQCFVVHVVLCGAERVYRMVEKLVGSRSVDV